MSYLAILKDTREPIWALEQTAETWFALKTSEATLQCPVCHVQVIPKGYKGGITSYHFAHIEDENPPECELRTDTKSAGNGTLTLQRHHAYIQKLVYTAIRDTDATLEKRINAPNGDTRIADVCIESQKYIFEVQVSSQSDVEESDRTQFYRNLGYTPIWIVPEPNTVNSQKQSQHLEHLRDRHIVFKIHEDKEIGSIPLEAKPLSVTLNVYWSTREKYIRPVFPLFRAVQWIVEGKLILHNNPIKGEVYWEMT